MTRLLISHTPFAQRNFFDFLQHTCPLQKKWALLVDSRFQRTLLPTLRRVWNKEVPHHSLLEIPLPGRETSKSLKKVQEIYSLLIRNGIDRQAGILALGGGTIGDLAGFVAGTFLRGIPWIGIPTTLIAQVDSCLGGKTGVNLPEGKNLIGIFHPPRGVFCDPHFLASLSLRDQLSGFGEMIKYGLLFDPELLDSLKIAWIQKEFMTPLLIRKCLKWKKKCVAADPLETKGIRSLLNLGHTLGHALEAETQYRFFRHGEAVLWGIRFALFLSRRYRIASTSSDQKELENEEAFLAQLPLPSLPTTLSIPNLIQRMQKDKKSTHPQKIPFILLKKRGQAVLCSDLLPLSEVKKSLNWFILSERDLKKISRGKNPSRPKLA